MELKHLFGTGSQNLLHHFRKNKYAQCCRQVYISWSQATLLDCKGITTPLILEDNNKIIMGKWIFLEGIADHHLFTYILKTLNSSWIEFGPSSHPNSVALSQRDMLSGKCQFKAINATLQNSSFYVSENYTVTQGKFLPSCLDCVTINFISQFNKTTINSLYLFKRESHRTESDMDMYWKQAECLGLKRESQYSYDGVTDLCHEAPDNSSDHKSNMDKSNQ
ncbi:saxitoxin and tetrodotoxin-binding protein 2-like [Xyrauchen texanus]|uniref:saxitoxin and tetrodotoxin-binding protein 2-like n=1 Tax=Xyrauchen texanus TaxID=154827 RepID=UPI002241F6FC|nr:saxitoxin and tetrodotoxin-binding protein 2-like [Xyrauchen texanus]